MDNTIIKFITMIIVPLLATMTMIFPIAMSPYMYVLNYCDATIRDRTNPLSISTLLIIQWIIIIINNYDNDNPHW